MDWASYWAYIDRCSRRQRLLALARSAGLVLSTGALMLVAATMLYTVLGAVTESAAGSQAARSISCSAVELSYRYELPAVRHAITTTNAVQRRADPLSRGSVGSPAIATCHSRLAP